MSDTSWAESLLARFVIPLVRGAEVHVGAPLGSRAAQRVKDAIGRGLDGTQTGQALSAARHEALVELGCTDEAPTLSDDPLAPLVLIALHDLLFLQHPESSRLKPEARASVLAAAQRLAERAELTADPTELPVLLGRHSLLSRLFMLERDDTRRQTRSGVEVFKGQPAPRRWFSDDDDDEVLRIAVLPELAHLQNGLGTATLQALLRASPLTALYQPLRTVPPVELLPLGGWLALPRVARLITRRYLELGLPAVGPVLSGALLASFVKPEPDADAEQDPDADRHRAAWLCFLSHLHLVAHVVGGVALPTASAAAETLDFYALYAALHTGRPALAAPPDAHLDPSLRAAIAQHAARCQGLVGPSRVRKLLPLIAPSGRPHVEIA